LGNKVIFGVCGIYCEICPVYSRKENRCFGCDYYNEFMRKKGLEECILYVCAKRKGVETCFKCTEFPCDKHYKYGLYGKEALDSWKKLIKEGLKV